MCVLFSVFHLKSMCVSFSTGWYQWDLTSLLYLYAYDVIHALFNGHMTMT